MQMQNRKAGRKEARKKRKEEHVRALLAQWQAQDNTPILPPILTQNGETPTQALFRKWQEEDANMTEEEQ